MNQLKDLAEKFAEKQPEKVKFGPLRNMSKEEVAECNKTAEAEFLARGGVIEKVVSKERKRNKEVR